jgi:NAD(P)-dependent dehydrogenase (short-subunit alcohol dehydrogenase family)
MDLDGAAALVTGGASGIGAATVRDLRAAGARVAVLDLADTSDADLHVRVDVGDEPAIVDAVARVTEELGGLDVAVLNAGVGGMSPLLRMTTDEWDRVMRVNLRGVMVLLRECGKAMAGDRPAGDRVIVAVSSVSGFLTDRYMAHYSVSKAGVAALVRVAARELGAHGIRVNAVAPGTTDTPMFAATDALAGYRERVAGRAALGRLGTADDVAAAVVALLRLEWVTGQVLVADGGVSLFSPIDPAEGMGSR